MLRGRTLLPVHWGTFQLALHAWSQPAEHLWEHAPEGTVVAFPRPGETVVAGQPAPAEAWWRPGTADARVTGQPEATDHALPGVTSDALVSARLATR
jgi:hypothetical protein